MNTRPTEIYLVEYSFTSKWDNKTHTYYRAYETLKLAKAYKTRKINKGYQNVILWAYSNPSEVVLSLRSNIK